MSGTAQEVTRAEHAATAARARLMTTIGEIQDRLQPRELVREGVDRLRERGEDLAEQTVATVRANPAATATAGGALALFLLRRPLGRLVGRLFSRKAKADRADDPFHQTDSNAPPRA